MKTWFLQTERGRGVFVDASGDYTVNNLGSYPRVEYIESQLFDGKEVLAKKISKFLEVKCVWTPGPNLDIYGP
jgi:hypothetical protein